MARNSWLAVVRGFGSAERSVGGASREEYKKGPAQKRPGPGRRRCPLGFLQRALLSNQLVAAIHIVVALLAAKLFELPLLPVQLFLLLDLLLFELLPILVL